MASFLITKAKKSVIPVCPNADTTIVKASLEYNHQKSMLLSILMILMFYIYRYSIGRKQQADYSLGP